MAYIELGDARISAQHYVNGGWRDSVNRFDVNSPIDGRRLGEVAHAGADDVAAAVEAAAAAFPAWAALGAQGRLPYLKRFAEEIGKRAEAFCWTESNDAGVLLSRMRHGVIPRVMLNITWFAEAALTLQDRVIETPQARHLIRHDPAGVCGIITPWNAPLMLTTWKVGPALASGNCVVIKPPEWAPLTNGILAEAAHAAGLPPGVFNMVQGDGAVTGSSLVSDPRLSRVSFTGSVPTARKIAQAAGANLTPCSLELGGKSPFIVLASADLDAAAATGALMYRNAGQVCLAGTRFLVQASVAEEFTARMRAYVEALNIGDPREGGTEVGPIIHARQIDRIKGYVDRAKAAGADVLWGGDSHAYGELYYQPTMLTGLKQSDEIVQEEVFGPVLVMQTFTDTDEAIAMANDVEYGLGGVCYGAEAEAIAFADKVRTGFIWINSFGIRDLAAPFGGIKNSGVGREGGEWSFDFFTDVKDIVVPTTPFKPSFSHR